MNDTSPEMDEKMRQMIQLRSPSERAMMGLSMYATSKKLVTDAILRDNPDISKADLRKQLFLKFYGNDFTPEEQQKILFHLEHVE
jgi:hypothetical protein